MQRLQSQKTTYGLRARGAVGSLVQRNSPDRSFGDLSGGSECCIAVGREDLVALDLARGETRPALIEDNDIASGAEGRQSRRERVRQAGQFAAAGSTVQVDDGIGCRRETGRPQNPVHQLDLTAVRVIVVDGHTDDAAIEGFAFDLGDGLGDDVRAGNGFGEK